MLTWRRSCVLFSFLAFLIARQLLATTYYVEPPPAGADSNDGSFAAPFATVQKAADVVGPGTRCWSGTGCTAADRDGFVLSINYVEATRLSG